MVFGLFRRLLKTIAFKKTLRNLQYSPHPWRTFLFLVWPIPWRYRLPPPSNPLYIRDHPDTVIKRYYVDEDYKRLRPIPIFRIRDTPLRSLYRLHDVIYADSDNSVMLESNYFWDQEEWRIKDIPDPKDPDPLRYAILASLVESMVSAFNFKISIGLRHGRRPISFKFDEAARLDPNKPFEEVPSWTSHVPPVEEWISFLENGVVRPDGTPFGKRHICASAFQLRNI
ncbi:hypothetical protein Hypma_006200 [Hypsizygus marmoreus]|uniref:Uncharacterized protein n=1 Tax=Hypsizygus marmoreus TaxID=39966 RepID=A0A369K0P4_HYPMA|nr:hypothetical protein Hypma_006200 [Hypsizygus marmoreus]